MEKLAAQSRINEGNAPGLSGSQGSDDQSVTDITKVHKARLKSLSALLKRKAAIEEAILQSTAKLEKAFVNANHELQTVLDARLAEGHKSIKALDIMEAHDIHSGDGVWNTQCN
ncbi:MAG: hypothetical protein Q9218_001144 [Villophora microphyllina]